jgi:hypothetical protein
MHDRDDGPTASSFERWLTAIERATAWSRTDATDGGEHRTSGDDRTDRTVHSRTASPSTATDDRPPGETGPETHVVRGPGRREVRFGHPQGGVLLVRRAGPGADVAGHALLSFALPSHVAEESDLFGALADAYRRLASARKRAAVTAVSRPPPVAVTTVEANLADARYRALADATATVAVDVRRLHARLLRAITSYDAGDDSVLGRGRGGDRP